MFSAPTIGKQLGLTLFLLAVVLSAGTIGYRILGGQHADWLSSLYMSVVTLTTVGYHEIVDSTDNPTLRIFTMVLLLSGLGVMFYGLSTVIGLFVEGELKQIFWRKKMLKTIGKLSNHTIVCGGGEGGGHIVRELLLHQQDFVVIDIKREQVERLIRTTGDFPFIIGDATQDDVLEQAGIQQARGLITVLSSDQDNLFVALSARQINPHIRIIARGIDTATHSKFLKAGADRVINPNRIGAAKMISGLMRPNVSSFLESMMQDPSVPVSFEEYRVKKGSHFEDKKLSETRIREKTGISILAVKDAEGQFVYNPPPDTVLRTNMTLIMLGDPKQFRLVEETM